MTIHFEQNNLNELQTRLVKIFFFHVNISCENAKNSIALEKAVSFNLTKAILLKSFIG